MVGRSFSMGEPVRFHSPHDSHALGITAHSSRNRVGLMIDGGRKYFFWVTTQWPSIFFYWIGQNHGRAFARELSSINATHGPSNQILRELSIAKNTSVGIARALLSTLKWWFLDEPTPPLSHHEFNELYELVNTLKGQGKGDLFLPINLMRFCFGKNRYTCFVMVVMSWRLYQGIQWISWWKWW